MTSCQQIRQPKRSGKTSRRIQTTKLIQKSKNTDL
jgi:hypothetical protein